MGMLGCYPTLNIPNDTDVFPTNDMKQQVWNVLHCKYIPLNTYIPSPLSVALYIYIMCFEPKCKI